MKSTKRKQIRRARRKAGIRKRIVGTPECPRLSVYRSLSHIYAQIIDDLAGHTLVAANSRSAAIAGGNGDGASVVGKQLAEKATAAGIKRVTFDRNGNKYHGRIKALADTARAGGLKF